MTTVVVTNQLLLVALSITLFAPACGGACESKKDSYSGADPLPYGQLTAEQVVAASKLQLAEQRSWIPDPSQYEGGAFGPTPPLPFEGSTQLEIEVVPLRDELVDGYNDSSEYGCDANGSPEAPVRMTIRTSDGVLNEEVQGTLSTPGGAARVNATITAPKGRIKEYFASYEYPEVPKLTIEIASSHVSLQFVLERRRKDGTSYDYVTLL